MSGKYNEEIINVNNGERKRNDENESNNINIMW